MRKGCKNVVLHQKLAMPGDSSLKLSSYQDMDRALVSVAAPRALVIRGRVDYRVQDDALAEWLRNQELED